MKILHSADWHINSPLNGFDPDQRGMLKSKLLEVPGKIAAICVQEECDLVLLSGDLFDMGYDRRSYEAVYKALEQMKVPVFICPGNHDFYGGESPWDKELWPDNVYIFTRTQVESVSVADLDCRVYGAAFTDKDCPALLNGFRAEQTERYAVGVFHGDPGQADSPYNPVTVQQVRDSGLDYMALGHIHKGDSFRAGDTLCVLPGCPMGTGFHEAGTKGVHIVTLEETASSRFVPLDVPAFYDFEVQAGDDPVESVAACLPAADNGNFYRVTLVGQSEPVELDALRQAFSGFSNLFLRDRTTAPVDLWVGAGEDSFEGMYFGLLKQQLDSADETEKEKILLAAKISRLILSGQEVALS